MFQKGLVTIGILLSTLYLLVVVSKMFFADILYKDSLTTGNLTYATSAIKLFPNNPFFLIQTSLLSAQSNLPNQAEKFSKQALQISPGEINFYKTSYRIYTILATKNPIYLKNALLVLQKAESIAPTDAVIPYQIANILAILDDSDQAIKYYQKSILLKPNYDIAMIQLAKLYKEQKNYSEAKKLIESAIKINPANSIHRN